MLSNFKIFAKLNKHITLRTLKNYFKKIVEGLPLQNKKNEKKLKLKQQENKLIRTYSFIQKKTIKNKKLSL